MKRYASLIALALGATALFFLPGTDSSAAYGSEGLYTARVEHVYDGDTLEVKDGHGYGHRIRLASVDAPELKQPWGVEARAYLTSKINQRYVTVKPMGKDLYKREVANIYYHDEDVNKNMLEMGLAWHYKMYSYNPEYATVEQQSRKEHQGLWSEHNPVEPWIWRQQHPI